MRPLLSACMIVRDESDNLPRCLASLRGVVDEIVVHDTGSVDDTVELARAAGATVIEGTWHDDFARARNTALEGCTGTWILQVDADEELRADPAVLRARLRGLPSSIDGCIVTIDNLADDGHVGLRHRSIRLFRADRGRWHGDLHEQLRAPGGGQLSAVLVEEVELLHHGYLQAAMEGRGKAERNVALAEAALAAASREDEARLLLDLGRSLATAGRYDDALARYEQARPLPASVHVQAWVLRAGAETALALGRPDDALGWVAELRTRGLGSEVSDLLEGSALVQLGRGADALALFEGITEAWDATGVSVPEHLVRQRRALARIAAGDHSGAAADLLALVAERPALPLWGHAAAAAVRSNGAVQASDVAAAVPDERLRAVLVQLLFTDADAAEAVAQALWARQPDDPRLLAFAVNHAPRLDVGPALEWSVRLRAAGLEEHCPLLAGAGGVELAPLQRLLAAAVAHGTFADDRAATAALEVAPAVGDDELVDALVLLGELTPDLLPPFVLAVSADASRVAALADALDHLGASEQATLLRAS